MRPSVWAERTGTAVTAATARNCRVDGRLQRLRRPRPAEPGVVRRAPVTGIDLSPSHRRWSTTRVDGTFRLVYLVLNAIGNLETQEQQVACFANAAAHLEPGGWFVVEVGVPDLRRLVPGQDAIVFSHAPGSVGYDRYVDLVAQRAVSHHFVVDGSGAREVRTPFRYVWPSEVDLMARLAGLTRCHRWAGSARSPFTGDSPSHVSVWQKPPALSSRRGRA